MAQANSLLQVYGGGEYSFCSLGHGAARWLVARLRGSYNASRNQ